MYDIARKVFPDILGVFVNTGNEYPDIVRFVNQKIKEGWNIQIIRPKLTPRQVWEQYGFPLVSKETASYVYGVRHNPTSKTSLLRMTHPKFGIPKKWRYLITEPYVCHNICCTKLKKDPLHRFQKETGRNPIIGTMTTESKRRQTDWLRYGCNIYEGRSPMSKPLSIWTEEDIWEYIKRNNLDIADIYHKGAQRTGCMGCGFGAMFADDNRFELLHKLYPKCYDMVMNYTNNGVTFREALRKTLAVNKLRLPDEREPALFD